MNCPNCSTFCEEGVRFCPVCGTRIAGEQSDFIPLNPMPETASSAVMSPAEMIMRQNEEKTEKTYRGLLIFSLFLALFLVAGAIYIGAFYSPNENAQSPTDTAEEAIQGLVGSWMNDDGYIVLTASGKVAADEKRGTYTNDESVIVMEFENSTVISDYVISEDDELTLTTSRLGADSSFTYLKVTSRTDLTYSELTKMWEDINN